LFALEFVKSAFKELSRLERKIQRKILEHIELLRENPFEPRPKVDIALVKGEKMRLYRLRVGGYRVFYAVEGEKVIILGVGHRGGAYKRS
jgi:mRNA interferase RelE/StbE